MFPERICHTLGYNRGNSLGARKSVLKFFGGFVVPSAYVFEFTENIFVFKNYGTDSRTLDTTESVQ